MTTEELKNAAGFKAVDAEGNELGVVSLSDIVSAVKQELQPSGVARASVAALSEVSTQAATDTYEDQLPQKTDVTWIRGLDESGNPILISKQSLVSVAEGLIGTATKNKNGLLPSTNARYNFIDEGLRVVSLGEISAASFLLNSNNAYAKGFLIYIDCVFFKTGEISVIAKKLFDVNVADSINIGYRKEGNLVVLYIYRHGVPMSIQCLSKQGNVNLIYEDSSYPADCISIEPI